MQGRMQGHQRARQDGASAWATTPGEFAPEPELHSRGQRRVEDAVLAWQQSVRSGCSIAPRLRGSEPYFGVQAEWSPADRSCGLPYSGLRRARRVPASTGDLTCTLHRSAAAQLRTSSPAALALVARSLQPYLPHTLARRTPPACLPACLPPRHPRALGVASPSLSPITLRTQRHFGRP